MKGLPPHVLPIVGAEYSLRPTTPASGESAALARHCHCQEVILKIVADREAEKSSESIIRAIRERGEKGRAEEIEMRIDKRKEEHNSASTGQRQQSPSRTPARVWICHRIQLKIE